MNTGTATGLVLTPLAGVKVDIHGLHQNGRGHITCKEGKARVLTKAQQGVMDQRIRDDAELLHVLLKDLGLGSNKRSDELR